MQCWTPFKRTQPFAVLRIYTCSLSLRLAHLAWKCEKRVYYSCLFLIVWLTINYAKAKYSRWIDAIFSIHDRFEHSNVHNNARFFPFGNYFFFFLLEFLLFFISISSFFIGIDGNQKQTEILIWNVFNFKLLRKSTSLFQIWFGRNKFSICT